jgi:hypothetical protein
MTQLIAIFIVLSLALAILFMAWVAISACVVSGRISEQEHKQEQ